MKTDSMRGGEPARSVSSAPARSAVPGRAGVRFGVLIGCTAWILALGGVCLSTGRFELLWSVVVPMLLASVALGMLVLAAVEPVLQAPPEHQARVRLPLVFGSLLAVMGVLLLLAEAFVVPVLQQDRALGDLVRSTGGVLELPRWVSLLLLTAGITTLAIAQTRTAGLRGRADPGADPGAEERPRNGVQVP